MQPGQSLLDMKAHSGGENNKWSVTKMNRIQQDQTSEKHTPSASQICSSLGLGDNSNFPKCIKDMQKAKVTPTHQLGKVNQLRSI